MISAVEERPARSSSGVGAPLGAPTELIPLFVPHFLFALTFPMTKEKKHP